MDLRHHRVLRKRLERRCVWPAVAFYAFPLRCCYADRTGERFFHIAAWWWGVMIAYIIGLSTSSIGGRYFALFLMASGYSGT